MYFSIKKSKKKKKSFFFVILNSDSDPSSREKPQQNCQELLQIPLPAGMAGEGEHTDPWLSQGESWSGYRFMHFY